MGRVQVVTKCVCARVVFALYTVSLSAFLLCCEVAKRALAACHCCAVWSLQTPELRVQ
jgi:hypothetical protein